LIENELGATFLTVMAIISYYQCSNASNVNPTKVILFFQIVQLFSRMSLGFFQSPMLKNANIVKNGSLKEPITVVVVDNVFYEWITIALGFVTALDIEIIKHSSSSAFIQE